MTGRCSIPSFRTSFRGFMFSSFLFFVVALPAPVGGLPVVRFPTRHNYCESSAMNRLSSIDRSPSSCASRRCKLKAFTVLIIRVW